MAGEVGPSILLERPEEEQREAYSRSFEAKVRYLASSLIVTIPARVARELGLKLGDRVQIQVRKKRRLQSALTA